MAHPFIQCLTDASEALGLKPSQIEKATTRFENLADRYTKQGIDPLTAANRAASEVTLQFHLQNVAEKRRRVLNMRASIRMWRDFQKAKPRLGKGTAYRQWDAFFDVADGAPYDNYANLKSGYQNILYNEMDAVVQKFRTRLGGIYSPRKGQDDMLSEIFGEDTGNAEAKVLADAWKKATDRALQLFKQVGGDVRELDIWRVPQHQDWLKLRGKKDEWINQHLEWLDWTRVERSDGRLLETVDERKAFLSEAFDTLESNGSNKVDLGRGFFQKNFTNKLENHRQLHYKDAASWKAMHEAYGSGSLFDVMVAHIDQMAHEIAMTNRFGPSPQANMENLRQMIAMIGNRDGVDPGSIQKEQQRLTEMANVIFRQTGMTKTDGVGHATAGARTLITSALLGGATTIAVPTDINMAYMSKVFNKFEGVKFLRRYLSMMNPASQADRRRAERSFFVAENVLANLIGARRYIGGMDIYGPAWTRKISDVAMNLNLLTPHTQNARYAYGMEMLGMFADHAHMRFDELPFRGWLERSGITEAEWDKFRALDPVEDGGWILRPHDLLTKYGDNLESQQLFGKIYSAVLTEARIAIPDATLQAQMLWRGSTRPGTVPGEVMRSVGMFKSFPATFMMIHMQRYMINAVRERGLRGGAYAAYLILSMTMIGSLRQQMQAVSQGRDPEDMTNWSHWQRAMFTGGGLGIFGDYILADYNRFGGDPIAAIGGPLAQFGSDTLRLTLGNAQQALEGKETNFWRETARFAERYTPGSRTWYLRLALQRHLWDKLIEAADPEAKAYFRKEAKRKESQFGERLWWERGKPLSKARTPDFGRAFGED